MGDFAEAHKKALQKSKKENWVRFAHDVYESAQTWEEKLYYVELAKENRKHCAICLNVNGCCFVKDKMPVYPHHPNCHCKIESVNHLIVSADCDIAKFTKYVFNTNREPDGKMDLFFQSGYDIMDSEWIREEFIRQAQEAYSCGNYKIGVLNEYGQRISIPIRLPKKNKNEYKAFYSGWMVYPDGRVLLTTPVGGRLKK